MEIKLSLLKNIEIILKALKGNKYLSYNNKRNRCLIIRDEYPLTSFTKHFRWKSE